jgi:hypothetical protein
VHPYVIFIKLAHNIQVERAFTEWESGSEPARGEGKLAKFRSDGRWGDAVDGYVQEALDLTTGDWTAILRRLSLEDPPADTKPARPPRRLADWRGQLNPKPARDMPHNDDVTSSLRVQLPHPGPSSPDPRKLDATHNARGQSPCDSDGESKSGSAATDSPEDDDGGSGTSRSDGN